MTYTCRLGNITSRW